MSKSRKTYMVLFLLTIGVMSCQKVESNKNTEVESFENVVERYFKNEYGSINDIKVAHKSGDIYWAYVTITGFSGFEELKIHRVIRQGDSNDFRVSSKMSDKELAKRAINFNY